MNRVEVTRRIIGLVYMQVCTVADASDQEILEACNRCNPCGTHLGWVTVEREDGTERSPVTCEVDHSRIHLLVSC